MAVLTHHGIKGQKWGVKNGPPYPLRKTLKEGHKLYRISSIEKETANTRLYATTNIQDSNIYLLRAKAVKDKLCPGPETRIYRSEYKMSRDVKIADARDMIKTCKYFADNFDNKQLCNMVYGDYYTKDQEILGQSIRNGFENPRPWNNPATILNNSQKFKNSSFERELYMRLQLDGYGGIEDLYDKNDWSKNPVILFNRDNVIHVKTKDLSNINYKRLYNKVDTYLKRCGFNSVEEVVSIGN